MSEELSKEQKRHIKNLHRLEKEKNRLMKLQGTEPKLEKVTVLCVRFGNKYGADYVIKLRNMVSRHLTIPYEFVCLTDDNHPIEGVRSIVQRHAGYAKPWWHKVHMFDPSLPLQGRILYLDLDVVVHHNIDKLFVAQGDDFLGILDFNRKFRSDWKSLNSSAMCWVHGTQNHIWDEFKKNPQAAQRLHGDQDWIWQTSRDKIKFWPKEWIQSYKWEVRSREDLSLAHGRRKFKTVDHSIVPHEDCCITVFHGDPKPQDIHDKFVVDNWR